MPKSEFLFILKSFLIWRLGVFLIAIFAVKFIPVFSHNYFGGGYSNYITNPIFWGHFNFDGEHYLAIARDGYKPLEYFFFPVFPLLMRYFSNLGGLIISNLFFLVALVGLYKLARLDFKEKVVRLTIILLLVFPTSFYFGMYYTESFFLALVVWSFYLFRKRKFLIGSILAALASATKVVGVIMFPPFGLLAYIYYLWKTTGDPLIFLHQVSIFGQQRSSTLILLPQVFYRYVFEILPHVSYSYFPNIFTTYLEFACGIVFLFLIIYGFFKLRISYSIYALAAYLIPTLAGSFSSMPRYVLVIFPVFILSASILDKIPKIYRYLIFSVMILMFVVAESLFWRGYWLS